MIDRREDRADWRCAALDSLQGQGVTVHRVDGQGRSVSDNRRSGWGLGTAPYVSLLDPDDLARPGGYAALRALMQARPGLGLYFTGETLIDGAGAHLRQGDSLLFPPSLQRICLVPACAHHLSAMRRDLVARALALAPADAAIEFFVRGACALWSGWAHTPAIGAAWRQHDHGKQVHRGAVHLDGVLIARAALAALALQSGHDAQDRHHPHPAGIGPQA